MFGNVLNPHGYAVKPQQPKDNTPAWKTAGAEIITARRELAKYGGTMDQYTRMKIQQQIADLEARHLPAILGGMAQEIKDAVKDLELSHSRLKVARGLEIASWNRRELADAIHLAKERVNLALNSPVSSGFGGPTAEDRIQNLWEEAQLAGDKYAVRALGEVLQGLTTKDSQLNQTILNVANRAEEITQQYQQTDQVKAAGAAIGEAEAWLNQVVKAEIDGYRELGLGNNMAMATDPVAQALERLQIKQSDDGEFVAVVGINPEQQAEVKNE